MSVELPNVVQCDRCPTGEARLFILDCEGKRSQVCLRCFLAHCKAHARCRECYGLSGFQNVYKDRMARKAAAAGGAFRGQGSGPRRHGQQRGAVLVKGPVVWAKIAQRCSGRGAYHAWRGGVGLCSVARREKMADNHRGKEPVRSCTTCHHAVRGEVWNVRQQTWVNVAGGPRVLA